MSTGLLIAGGAAEIAAFALAAAVMADGMVTTAGAYRRAPGRHRQRGRGTPPGLHDLGEVILDGEVMTDPGHHREVP